VAGATKAYLRIGELSRRTGVSTDLLRAWERRYGVVEPARSPGGFRLYSDEDAERIRAMAAHVAAGVAPAQAAAMVAARHGRRPAAGPRDPLLALRGALESFDAAAAHAALDVLLEAFGVESLIGHVVLPYLRDVGDRWERGEVSVAQEHFASAILKERLLSLARAWGEGAGPRALLACPPGELHDLGLIAFGLALRARGWQITFIGADAPIAAVAEAADALRPDAVVLAAVEERRFLDVADEIARLSAGHPVFVAGDGASEGLARTVGATWLREDPVAAARRLGQGETRPATGVARRRRPPSDRATGRAPGHRGRG
jgi:DNA-binding transcriptional MerR regulator